MTQIDWLGNDRSVHATLGSRTGATGERHEHDYYATPKEAVTALLAVEQFKPRILEPACGEGHISKVLQDAGHAVDSYDLIDRGYGSQIDFLSRMHGLNNWPGDIITNPPYAAASEFVERALEIVPYGCKVAMLLRTLFIESQGRKELFTRTPPHTMWQFSNRITCGKNGDFAAQGGGAQAFAWFVWIKGNQQQTTLKWL